MAGYRITPKAEQDLDVLAHYIARDNIDAALSLYEQAKQTYELLAQTPFIGASYPAMSIRLQGIRFFPLKGFRKYLVFYLPDEADGIVIIRVLHGARHIPSLDLLHS